MSEWAVLGAAVAVFLAGAIFIGFLFVLYRLLRWIWGRVPSTVLSFQAQQIDKPLGALLSVVFFPDLIKYAWQTFERLLLFVPELIGRMASVRTAANCDLDDPFCISNISSAIVQFTGFSAGRLIDALQLRTFPIVDFVWFLIVAVIAVQLVGAVRQGISTGKIRGWISTGAAAVPAPLRQRIAFTLLVLVSFYLGLSALLAIPLLQDRSINAEHTPDALAKALDVNLLSQETFDSRYTPELPKLREPALQQLEAQTLPVATDVRVSEARNFFEREIAARRRMVQELQDQWTAMRTSVFNEPARLRNQAREFFKAGLQIGGGRQLTEEHFSDLLKWHNRSSQDALDWLQRCHQAATHFVSANSAYLDAARGVIAASASSTLAPDFDRIAREASESYQLYFRVLDACRPVDNNDRLPIPDRKTVAQMLGPIGAWTRWLLDPQQMPVVIIVGLVGFSLLGATVSRAVRMGTNNVIAGMSLDDLLIVIAGGTTAAVVVFLAAYGGLAVLGNQGDPNPNPYVVFVTCLIGAVYSEDVWMWARRRLLTTRDDGGDQGAGSGGSGKQS